MDAVSNLTQILSRFFVRLQGAASWNRIGLAVAMLVLVLLFGTARWRGRWERRTWRATLIALTAIGLVLAWNWRWICDDAFITFRYAHNLAAGHGLVFNPGERVEGYTDFLWAILLAAAIRCKQDPGQVSVVLGVASYVLEIWLVASMARRLSQPSGLTFLPVAAILVAFNYSFASFATSGLETSFACLLATVALERALAFRTVSSALAGVLATMAHPDHIVFYCGLGLALLVTRRSWRNLGYYALPLVLVYLPYFAWRWSYYGDFWPNTYYAKSGDKLYFDQGVVYIAVSTLGSGLWGALPLALFGFYRRSKMLLGRYVIFAVFGYLAYIAKVGGDFMLGRLLCSAIPPICLLAELGLRDLIAEYRLSLAALGAAFAAFSFLPLKLIDPFEKAWHVADERTFYQLASFSPITVDSQYYGWAKSLRAHLTEHGVQPTLAIGCVGMIGYISELPLLDTFGLTDRGVAKTPIARRGRPGHEKSASPGYIWQQGTTCTEGSVFPPPYDAQTQFSLDGILFHFARYDPGVASALRGQAGVSSFDIVAKLDRYLQVSTAAAKDIAACDLWFFESFYFPRANDDARHQKLLDHLVQSGALTDLTRDFAASDEPERLQKWRRVDFIDFEQRPAGAIEYGNAFADWPSRRSEISQGVIPGVAGKFINTFQKDSGDGATGRLQWPLPIRGDVVTLRIGGGRDLERLRAALWVDGVRVASATGCDSELTGVRAFDVRAYKRKSAFIELVDDAGGGWGHLIVDDIAQWERIAN